MHHCRNTFHVAVFILNTKQTERWTTERYGKVFYGRKGKGKRGELMLKMGKEWRNERK